MAGDIGSPCVVVELTPYTAVVPASIATRNDKLVAGKFIHSETRNYGPVSVLERAECHCHDVLSCIEIVIGTYLAVDSFIKIGACRQ